MTFKQLILLTYAITAGAMAIGLTSDYTKALQMEYVQARSMLVEPKVVFERAPTVPVVTIARSLPLGHRLTRDDLDVQNWPVDAAPKGGFASIDQFLAAYAKPHARMELFEGEPLLARKLKEAGDGSALALLLPPDRRAVTIQVNEVRGVGGFVQPNDRVDVILTETADAATGARASRVLLQNILVLAVGQSTQRAEQAARVSNSVTLAVRLEEAQKLALATTVGTLSLALRNPEGDAVSGLQGVSLDDLGAVQFGKMRVVVHRGERSDVVVDRVTRTPAPRDATNAAAKKKATAIPQPL